MKNITVTIGGPTNSGTSTVATALLEVLSAAGIKVTLNDEDPARSPEFQAQRLKAIAEKTEVTIDVTRYRRPL